MRLRSDSPETQHETLESTESMRSTVVLRFVHARHHRPPPSARLASASQRTAAASLDQRFLAVPALSFWTLIPPHCRDHVVGQQDREAPPARQGHRVDSMKRGDELVLDVGCGHGLMLIAAAKQLSHGKAIGIDLWQRRRRPGRQLPRCDVEKRSVGKRHRARRTTGRHDARTLDFPDNTFDVVLSSWAIHNIYDAAGRAARCGRSFVCSSPADASIIVDIRCARPYAQVLSGKISMQDASR